MSGVVWIGGASLTGKSTLAALLAERLGFKILSTDGMAKHPGRPWRMSKRDVPAHVLEHYGTLSVDELVESVVEHYRGLQAQVRELTGLHGLDDSNPGLVLEGSALLPEQAPRLPSLTTVWLTAEESVLHSRARVSSRYGEATDLDRRLVDQFVARAARYQELIIEAVDRLHLKRIDTSSRDLTEVAETVLESLTRQG